MLSMNIYTTNITTKVHSFSLWYRMNAVDPYSFGLCESRIA